MGRDGVGCLVSLSPSSHCGLTLSVQAPTALRQLQKESWAMGKIHYYVGSPMSSHDMRFLLQRSLLCSLHSGSIPSCSLHSGSIPSCSLLDPGLCSKACQV